jgi:ribosomal-protein-alanine N-acetyltransferase
VSLRPRVNAGTFAATAEDHLRVRLQIASNKHEQAFLAAALASRALHRPWTSPPKTAAEFRRYLKAKTNERNIAYFAFVGRDLVGVVNVSEIVRGAFRSAYLGYYAFSPHHRQGLMTEALSQVVTRAFRKHGLHRVEANIQPSNVASLRLIRRLGFRKEGLSRRYLKIGGRWRDHERWAITREDWKGRA